MHLERAAAVSALVWRLAGGLAGLAGLALLIALFRVADAAWIRLFLAGAAGLAMWRPGDALLVVAGLGPVIGVYGAAAGAPFSLRELLVLATFTGWAAYLARTHTERPLLPCDLSWPLVAALAVISTSIAVELYAFREMVGPDAFASAMEHILERGLLVDRHAIRGLHPGGVYLEGLAIFAAAAALCTRRPALARQATAMAAAGAAGAALVNIQRVVVAAQMAESPFRRLRELLVTTRISVGFPDVNAAGSYFAMTLFPAATLAIHAAGWRRALWTVAAGAIFGAAWLSGSRAAIGAIIAVTVAAALTAARRDAWSRRAVAVILAGCLVVAVSFVAVFPNRIFGAGTPRAIQIRMEMARISLALVDEHPLFGTGVGGFHAASEPWLAGSSIAAFYGRENAHNHALQWLAELGLVGFAAFAWLIWCAVRRLASGLRGPGRPVAAALAAGLSAFALTALLGHPLLTAEVNHVFWLLLGIACGTAPRRDVLSTGSRTAAWRPRVAALAVIALACGLLPWRFHEKAARLPLEHVRYGASVWHTDEDGTRYQVVGGETTMFVPSDAQAVDIPLRLGPGEAAIVEIRFRNRVADRLVVTSTAWHTYRLVVGHGRSDRLYLPVHVRVVDGPARPLHIGRTLAR